MGAIRRLATQDGLDLVIDKQAAPYVRSDLDVTDRIITLYNQGSGDEGKGTKKEGAAPAAGPAPAPLALPNATPPATVAPATPKK